MYYEEKMIRGYLMCRTDPHGQWEYVPSSALAKRLEEMKKTHEQKKSNCGWEWDSVHYVWVTGCKQEHEMGGRAPDEIGTYEYCPYCGGRIVEETSE